MSANAGLSVAEAAARLGISRDAVRRRIDRQSIKATKADDGTWRVHLPADPSTPDPTTDTTTDYTLRGDTLTTALLAEKDARIALLTDQLSIKDRQIQELHVMLQTAQRQLPATVPEPAGPRERPLQEESAEPTSNAPHRGADEAEQVSSAPRRRGWIARLLGLE